MIKSFLSSYRFILYFDYCSFTGVDSVSLQVTSLLYAHGFIMMSPPCKSPHKRTYQNKNLEAVFLQLCTWQLRTCFSLMKYRFFIAGVAKLIFD